MIRQVVAYLEPTTLERVGWQWSIYRLRMAMADGGELLIIAPGVRHLVRIAHRLIRIRVPGTPYTLEMVERIRSQENLSAAH